MANFDFNHIATFCAIISLFCTCSSTAAKQRLFSDRRFCRQGAVCGFILDMITATTNSEHCTAQGTFHLWTGATNAPYSYREFPIILSFKITSTFTQNCGQWKQNVDNSSPYAVPTSLLHHYCQVRIPTLGRWKCLHCQKSHIYDSRKLRIYGILNWIFVALLKWGILVYSVTAQRTVHLICFVICTQYKIWLGGWGDEPSTSFNIRTTFPSEL